jgi:hypothetical protein
MDRLTSSYPPAIAGDTPKSPQHPTPEMKTWLDRGWQAKCCRCGYHFVSNAKPGDARCPRCNDLPTLSSCMAAIASMPQPQTDSWNKREARRVHERELSRAKKEAES